MLQNFSKHPIIQKLLSDTGSLHTHLLNVRGSLQAIVTACLSVNNKHFVLLNDKEEAAYFYNDLCQMLDPDSIYFLPSSYKRSPEYGNIDPSNLILRTEALNFLSNDTPNGIIVSYPMAFFEKAPNKQAINDATLKLKVGDEIGISFIVEVLNEYGFERVDFVYEPGQYSLRGSIIDIYSFSNENPYRVDFFGNDIDSIRTFDIETQLSESKVDSVQIVYDLSNNNIKQNNVSILELLGNDYTVWAKDFKFALNKIKDSFTKVVEQRNKDNSPKPELFNSDKELQDMLQAMKTMEFSASSIFSSTKRFKFNSSPQPSFNKNFDLLEENLLQNSERGIKNFILSTNKKQLDRIKAIFSDKDSPVEFERIEKTLHEGFIDEDSGLCFYTDHEIFARYQKFSLRTDRSRVAKQALSLKELSQLNIGDYVVHVDHGIGKFGGLVNTEQNGHKQEAIRLTFKDGDSLLVNIHSLHRISKYKGKDGAPPRVNKLGTAAWQKLKDKTKRKVKDIARELISLYAKRKQEPGYSFSPDSYMQTELESSFIYEDTPDQEKSTQLVKQAMERDTPMDMLVCGDVGFGKTEIAIRAAFKAISDNKQVAVLVPTTILAMQHFNTFKERLSDFPCKVDYVSRLRKPKEIRAALKSLENGELDILIGTHRIIGKDVKFKDLGLLIIDEEQRFGVSIKEKLKAIKVNVDTLTLTATPIPRTLQFSLMGARDLSILNTPPPNRQPIISELHTFNEDILIEAISYEIDRNGQVFFINNRVQNILEIQKLIARLMPNVKTVVAHGQMDGEQLENIMLSFINGDYDVLIATTIIESGLDIPNANTIIINNAHMFGLSELHQLRGRVGRSNKRAFCYLLSPELSTLTDEARRRLRIIEEFSELGSGFNIAMQDLDLRGAGNLLGGEQSGFVADIGFETYHKILNEAMLELKEDEFKDLYKDELEQTDVDFVSDCHIETDSLLVIPSEYVESVAERMQLYRKLDSIKDHQELDQFKFELNDRFGEIPDPTLQLMQVVEVRWLAMKLGFEKIIFKNSKLICHFVNNQESAYYKTKTFVGILGYVQTEAKTAKLREKNEKLSLVFPEIKNISEIKQLLTNISNSVLA